MKKVNYILANGAKFHHFSIAKILHHRKQLSKIICGYPWFKLKNEKIPRRLVGSHGIFQILRYPILNKKYFNKISKILDTLNSQYIDKQICNFLKKKNDADVLITLSPVGINAGRKASQDKKMYICERSSAHITFQENILSEEYKEFMNIDFKINPFFVENELKMYNESDIIMVPSQFAKNTFDKNLASKIFVNEFGTDTSNFFPNKKISRSDKYFDIIFIGQKSLQKGLHYLIEAFNNLKYPNKRLHIIGSDTLDKHFFDKKLKKDNIIVYGHIPQLKLNNLINKCHVLVLPSIQDGFGIVTLQALSSGCPIIVSENTGPVEIIKKYNCGMIVPIRSSVAIMNCLQELSDDKNKLKLLSENALKFSYKNTWENYIDRLDDLVIKYQNNTKHNV